ncbi:MAG: hypothetical protein ACREA0_05290, partial [bacterium]
MGFEREVRTLSGIWLIPLLGRRLLSGFLGLGRPAILPAHRLALQREPVRVMDETRLTDTAGSPRRGRGRRPNKCGRAPE